MTTAAIQESAQSLVRVEGVHREFAVGGRRLHVLQGCDLSLGAGDFAAIVGPSGSGKTTLLHLVAGLERASRGRVVVAGCDLSKLSTDARARWRSTHVGLVFQDFLLLSHLTALENVELAQRTRARPRAERRSAALAALELVGLAERADHYPNQLSGGEQQRAGIARAIANDPPLLLCDEPTGNLSAKGSAHIFDLFEVLNRELGKTIVVVTHDAAMAARAQRRLRLVEGVIEENDRLPDPKAS